MFLFVIKVGFGDPIINVVQVPFFRILLLQDVGKTFSLDISKGTKSRSGALYEPTSHVKTDLHSPAVDN